MEKIINYSNTKEGKEQSRRLVDCRLNLGYQNARAFFEKYGQEQDLFSYSQYQKYESGERLLSKKAAMLYAKIFGVDWEWLKNGDTYNHALSEPADCTNLIKIDVLDVVACCGNGVENFSENVIGQHMMTLTALRELTSAAPENIKIIRAIGDSMTPTIRPGEMLWIDVSYTSPSSDGLYLIRIGKELLVRRIQLNPFDGSAVIKADNEAYRAFPAENFESVPVLGRVIYHVVRMV